MRSRPHITTTAAAAGPGVCHPARSPQKARSKDTLASSEEAQEETDAPTPNRLNDAPPPGPEYDAYPARTALITEEHSPLHTTTADGDHIEFEDHAHPSHTWQGEEVT